MNRERAKELLPIITAFANGQAIQYRTVGRSEWIDLSEADSTVGWGDGISYRIKPTPKLRHYNNEELAKLVGTKVRSKLSKNVFLVNEGSPNGGWVRLGISQAVTTAKHLLIDYVSAEKDTDGQPLGVEETE